MELEKLIRDVPNFPKEGIIFKDITTLLKDSTGLNATINALYDLAKEKGITKVAGIESRGFILGGALAQKLNAGFVPIRKPKKLPAETISASYELEYGTDKIEIHKDAIVPGDKVLLHDDLLATGGTMEAAVKLIEQLGGEVVQISFIIELDFLKGKEKLKNYEVHSLIHYQEE
ncbi:MAG: adenine phosphoribosyltransferase [Stygiobacter sp. RIFOXYC12_FULL_38_8]|nr:MAG: adenine phosphoribosyltransferase [Stygiobacter sp. GWC2_38_9]OGV09458.1 MAG: adenine phosphoribosyltransferase [Stygiobacter sp. RIFOXYB2_FULL_37_11]OGV15314.1 MAG: adenine phosphoribosyltransferase [Stygiobacter sp. RIFOXYC2_FULL_38_25]OGV30148.1 MAG: adenine phosphoribosyltransferase [Stygiobacter sp. RIFOXYC12_FULL_38_8]OGV79052.1 MAG: adenine phosphoribosyltransferase [Stygiobacter sp. GWF2_38_21]RJQ64353.1 MAG: adenine phosphoribosyltransferase [Stygiobacter sp.]